MPKYLIATDEGLHTFDDAPSNIRGRSALSLLQGIGRSQGVTFYVTTNALRLTDLGLRSNVYLTAALRPANGEDADHLARALDLTDAQREYLAGMPRGEAVVKIGRVPHAILCTYEPRTDTNDHGAFQRACERTTTYLAALNAERSATPLNTDSSAETEHPDTPHNVPPRKIALNGHAEALLRDVAAHPFTLTTPSYERCALHFMQGDRAKSLLLKLGLLGTVKVRTGKGRGKTGSCMFLTPAGYAWLGRRPAKVTRGGSAQHNFLAFTIARALGGSVETLGADVLVRFDSTQHEKLAMALNRELPHGVLVSVQIEVSDKRTIPPNAVRDERNGFDLTIFAVMPDLLPAARRAIEESERAVITDALHLVEALR